MLKEVGYGTYARVGPIFPFHIFKKNPQRFGFSQTSKKEMNVPSHVFQL